MVRRAALHVLLPANGGGSASAGAGPRVGRDDSDDHRAGPARLAGADQPQEGPSDSQSERLAGAAAASRSATPGAGVGLADDPAERTVGGGYDASLLRPRRLVPPDGDHRLLRPDH